MTLQLQSIHLYKNRSFVRVESYIVVAEDVGGSAGFWSGDLEPCDGAEGIAKPSPLESGSVVGMEDATMPLARRAR